MITIPIPSHPSIQPTYSIEECEVLGKLGPSPGLHESLQPCSRAARKWRENEEMRRKWRENEEMERDWLSTFPHSLSISSLFLHFLPLFPFPTSKCITFCCKMLNTALLSRMSQKSQHTRYEEIILGRTCCEEAPQFVPAWVVITLISGLAQCRVFNMGLLPTPAARGNFRWILNYLKVVGGHSNIHFQFSEWPFSGQALRHVSFRITR